MATVTGKSSVKIDDLLAQTLVGADLDDQGTLTFSRKNGSTINAGSLGASIVGAVINTAKHLIFTTMHGETIDAGSIVPNPLASWPVGSVYIGMTSTNPNTLFGGGTWVRLAKGKMLVGVDEADASFDAIRETGGSKEKILSAANLPPHPHTMTHTHPMPHTHEPGTPTNNFLVNQPAPNARNRANGDDYNAVGSPTTSGPSNPNTSGASTPNTGNGPGTSEPVDVMNPYITTYIWERTA